MQRQSFGTFVRRRRVPRSPSQMSIQLSDKELAFEEELHRQPYSLKIWWEYLSTSSGITAPPKKRNQLFERALAKLPGSYKLWHAYLNLRRKDVVGMWVGGKGYTRVNNLFERSLVFMHKMPRVWTDYLEFLSLQHKYTHTRRTFDRALRALPVTQHDRIWPLYIAFVKAADVSEMVMRVYRRYLRFEPAAAEEYIAYLVRPDVSELNEAAELLAKIVNDPKYESQVGKSRHALWMQLCGLITKNPDRVTSLPVEAIIRNGLNKFSAEVGQLWVSLADFHVRSGHFEKARDVYEEGMSTVSTVKDFSLIYDAYLAVEEGLLQTKMSQDGDADARSEYVEGFTAQDEVELRLGRLDHLINRQPELLSSVKLRQTPHSVKDWQDRVLLMTGQGAAEDKLRVVATYNMAVKTVEPSRALNGRPHELWTQFARFYATEGDMASTRVIYARAVQQPFKTIDDLAAVWCDWAELECERKNYAEALSTIQKAITEAESHARKRSAPAFKAQGSQGEPEAGKEPVQRKLYRSVKLWSFYCDLEESLGTLESVKAAYSRMIDHKIATAATILNFAQYLEEKNYFEESFKVYEKGVVSFGFPHVYDIWLKYLTQFVARYGGTKMERLRDLFDQAVEKCPAEQCKGLYLMYGKVEEDHGLVRHAMSVYHRAVRAVQKDDVLEIYKVYVSKASSMVGVSKMREVLADAMEVVPGQQITHVSLMYADMERNLGEVDRARAIFTYGSQFADPRSQAGYWARWQDFEVKHGNEDTFREMLRVKRSVAAQYQQVNMDVAEVSNNYQKAGVLGGQDSMSSLEAQAAQTGGTVVLERIDPAELEERRRKEMAADVGAGGFVAGSAGDDDGMDVLQMDVPAAVFGSAQEAAAKEATKEGALSRFKKSKQ